MQVVDPVESDTLGAMYLQIPGMGSRDLEDAVVERHGAEDWIWWGSTLYRPLASVPELAAGGTQLVIGTEGYAEWRALAAAGKVTITPAADGSGGGAVPGPAEWILFAEDTTPLASGSTFPATVDVRTAGCYLLVFGPASASATVTVAPAAAAGAGARSAHPPAAAPAAPAYRPPLR